MPHPVHTTNYNTVLPFAITNTMTTTTNPAFGFCLTDSLFQSYSKVGRGIPKEKLLGIVAAGYFNRPDALNVN